MKMRWKFLSMIGTLLFSMLFISCSYTSKWHEKIDEILQSEEKIVIQQIYCIYPVGEDESKGSQYGVYGAYGRHVMDAMVKLLSSKPFTERLLLEANGLPSMETYPSLNTNKYAKAIQAKKVASDAWAKVKALEKPRLEALKNLNDCWTLFGMTGTFTEEGYNKLFNSTDITVPQYLKDAYKQYMEANDLRIEAIEKATATQKETDAIVEILLEEWRDHPNYLPNISRFQKAVKYSYLGDNEDVADANNLTRSFIYVDISVLNDEEFAKDLSVRMDRTLPVYVQQNMIIPSGYLGTKVEKVSSVIK